MDVIKESLIKQYNKTLDILSESVSNYDEELWKNKSGYKYPAWQVAYHALFYANIYCAATNEDVEKWPKQKKDYHLFVKTKKQDFTEIYSRDDILEFLEFFRNKIAGYLEKFDPDMDCWPHWYDEKQLEFHINNIRHIQHHTGEMIERADIQKTFPYNWY